MGQVLTGERSILALELTDRDMLIAANKAAIAAAPWMTEEVATLLAEVSSGSLIQHAFSPHLTLISNTTRVTLTLTLTLTLFNTYI